MTQRIAQEHAISIAQKVGCSVRGHYDETGATPQEIERLCNAAIQHYIDQQAKELPALPEPQVEMISGHREPFVFYDADQLQSYGAACAAHAREMALEEAREIAWKCTCSDGDDYASAMDRMSAQFAEIAATEPVGAIYTIAGVQHCTITKTVDDTDLFTRPMPAQDVTELVELLEFMWRDVSMNEYAFEKLEAALSKYKGAK